MRHQYTSDFTQEDNDSQGSEQVIVHPSVLSILYYLDELEAQVPVPEDEPPASNPQKHNKSPSPSIHPTH